MTIALLENLAGQRTAKLQEYASWLEHQRPDAAASLQERTGARFAGN